MTVEFQQRMPGEIAAPSHVAHFTNDVLTAIASRVAKDEAKARR